MFFEHKGVRLFYDVAGRGDPVIVLHGGPGLSQDYLRPHLDPLGGTAALFFLDFASHGGSARQGGLTPSLLVEQVEAFRQHLGLRQVTTLGHSMGGFVAQLYARTYPESVARLILVSTADRWTMSLPLLWRNLDVRHRWQLVALALTRWPDLLRDRTTRYMPAFMKAAAPFYVKRMTHEPEVDAGHSRAAKQDCVSATSLMSGFNKLEFAGTVLCPTLLICGDADRLMRHRQGSLHSLYPDASFHWLDAGHFPFIEDRGAFLEAIRQFLNTSDAMTAGRV